MDIFIPGKRSRQVTKEIYCSDISSNVEDQPDAVLAKQIGSVLVKHYPGHSWGVQVRPDQGIVTIRNMALLGNWAFLIRMDDLDRPALKVVMRGAGELLERYRLSRGAAKIEEYRQIPTNFAGIHIPDI